MQRLTTRSLLQNVPTVSLLELTPGVPYALIYCTGMWLWLTDPDMSHTNYKLSINFNFKPSNTKWFDIR